MAETNERVFKIRTEMNEEGKSYILSSDKTVRDLKERWAEDTRVSSTDVVLFTTNNELLIDSQRLAAIEVCEGDTIELKADFGTHVYFELYEREGEQIKVTVSLKASPEVLERLIREKFDIPATRKFQLINLDEPLKSDESLASQNVRENTLLFVDLAFTIAIVDKWNNGNVSDEQIVYSSDKWQDVIPDDILAQCHLKIAEQLVSGDERVIDTFRPFLDATDQSTFPLIWAPMQNIVVLSDKNIFLTHRMLPDVLPNPKSSVSYVNCDDPTKLGGSFVPLKDQPVGSQNLPDSSLLHKSFIIIQVKLNNHKYQIVRLPQLAAVKDVREVIQSKMNTNCFDIKRKTRILDENELVKDAITSDDKTLEVECRENIKVTVDGHQYNIAMTQKSFRFSDVMAGVEAASGKNYSALLNKSLYCAGCERKLSKEKEKFQPIPAPCCETQSLELTEPIEKQSAAVQTPITTNKESESQTDKPLPELQEEASPKHIAEEEVVAVPEERQAVVPKLRNYQVPERVEFAVQHPPLKPMKICVWDLYHGEKNESLLLELNVPEEVTVGAIRGAIAKEMDLDLHDFHLGRPFAFRQKEEVFLVCDPDDQFTPPHLQYAQFCSVEGRLFDAIDVFPDKDPKKLDDDNAIFVEIPGRVNTINIDRN